MGFPGGGLNLELTVFELTLLKRLLDGRIMKDPSVISPPITQKSKNSNPSPVSNAELQALLDKVEAALKSTQVT